MSDTLSPPSAMTSDDLPGLWSDLEDRLSALLHAPQGLSPLADRLGAIAHDMERLLTRDADGSLFLLFQLVSSSPVGYSASHALVCGSLCHLVAEELSLTPEERTSLELAALTMNIAMTGLQDELAAQRTRPTAEQLRTIDRHATDSAELLRSLGIQDALWLQTVERHHEDKALPDRASLLAHTLMAVDRYAALISPRETRSGRNVTDSARSVVALGSDGLDPVGHALLKTVGICPPGTFVRLDNQQVAVVLHRSGRPGTPLVVPVLDGEGRPILDNRLVDTAEEEHQIEAALLTSSVRVRLNHGRLLRLAQAVG